MTDEVPGDAAMKTRTTLQKIEVLEPGPCDFLVLPEDSCHRKELNGIYGICSTAPLVPCRKICDSTLLSKVVTGQPLATIKIPSMPPKGVDRESVVESGDVAPRCSGKNWTSLLPPSIRLIIRFERVASAGPVQGRTHLRRVMSLWDFHEKDLFKNVSNFVRKSYFKRRLACFQSQLASFSLSSMFFEQVTWLNGSDTMYIPIYKFIAIYIPLKICVQRKFCLNV